MEYSVKKCKNTVFSNHFFNVIIPIEMQIKYTKVYEVSL